MIRLPGKAFAGPSYVSRNRIIRDTSVGLSLMMLTSRTYSGREAQGMHLANFCFPDDRFEAELATLCADILANSWFANQVVKRALIETEGLTLRDAYALGNGCATPDVERFR